MFVKGEYSLQSCSLYTDDLITDLKLSRYGANIGNIFAGCLLYADDIVLLSPTCHGLQKLITACEQYGRLWDLKFNSLKSQVQLLAANAQLTQ